MDLAVPWEAKVLLNYGLQLPKLSGDSGASQWCGISFYLPQVGISQKISLSPDKKKMHPSSNVILLFSSNLCSPQSLSLRGSSLGVGTICFIWFSDTRA